MKRLKQSFLLAMLAASASMTAQTPLPGFQYAAVPAPDGNEWQSPERLALNKEQPRAYVFPFENAEQARLVLPEHSAYWISLDGNWKFNWVGNPGERPTEFYKPTFDVSGWDEIPVPSNWNIYGIQKDGSLKYGVPIYVNQPVIFMHKVAVDDWRGGVMRTPPSHWTTYQHRNEVGSYRRNFTVPQSWDGREVYISFDGVDSFFYLWINGQYVGFSKNSRNAASFNITPYLQKGENVLAVEVYRSSDGSFLEAQDMFRLAGIFRTVQLYSTAKVQVRDLVVKPDLTPSLADGVLNIQADIRNLDKKTAAGYTMTYSLYANELYSDKNEKVAGVTVSAAVPVLKKGENAASQAVLKVAKPNLWSAERPYRYVLVAELKDKKGRTVETVSTHTGFRKVEIKDTPASEDEFGLAGRYYYVNGKTVKLKGVNRHETNPEVGHAVTRQQMEDEVMLMLRGNINHVRNSHYPDAPYWYYLCDKYGIYLEDEANIESHQYYYGDASLSHPKEWESAHVARVMEMAHATVNRPSVVIWSLGNEAGPGKNFVTAYQSLKKFDDTRPVQYERNNDIVDMGSNQYPSIAWMRGAVQGKYNIKYPFHVSEYAHSMGNACGNLVDYWDAIESTNFFMGGAIWDWIDQSMYNYDKNTGERYLAYGGDFGDTPNDGQFVMNGIVFADMQPKPQYYEVKKVYQYIGVKAVDLTKGEVEVFNKNYFTDLSDYQMVWSLYEDGKSIQKGEVQLGQVAPRSKRMAVLPIDHARLRADAEYFVKVQFLLKEDKPWAKKGFVQAEEQLVFKAASGLASIAEVAKTGEKLVWSQTAGLASVKGAGFELSFDLTSGTIAKLNYGHTVVFSEGNGPKLDAFRAFVNNDNWAYRAWFENGLHNLKHTVQEYSLISRPDGALVAVFAVKSQAPCGSRIEGNTSSGRFSLVDVTDKPFGDGDFHFTTNQIFTVYPDGSIELQAGITSSNAALDLARLGYLMQVDRKLDEFTYYGRGPIGNYADRKTGQFVEQFTGKVVDQFVKFPKPQDCANHEEVRWAALADGAGNGALFVGGQPLSVQALPYSALDMTMTPHPHQLTANGNTYLFVGLGSTGLGGNSCGQGAPLEFDRVKAAPHTMGFVIRPAGGDLAAKAKVKLAGETPIVVTRDRVGDVSITSVNPDAEIMYQVGKEKPQLYTKSISMRQGGKLTAWYANNKQIRTSATFAKLDRVPTVVMFASSEEVGDGDAVNLTDGNSTSIWHTMYSVTVAKHPHWVDFDAGEVKSLTGITYLPRQDGSNGDVKDFTVHVSMDGKEWGEPVLKGTFPRNKKEQKVLFEKPVKGRYVRFTALSEQNGQDYATGAEFSVLADE